MCRPKEWILHKKIVDMNSICPPPPKKKSRNMGRICNKSAKPDFNPLYPLRIIDNTNLLYTHNREIQLTMNKMTMRLLCGIRVCGTDKYIASGSHKEVSVQTCLFKCHSGLFRVNWNTFLLHTIKIKFKIWIFCIFHRSYREVGKKSDPI